MATKASLCWSWSWSCATPSLKHFDLTCACLSVILNQGCNKIVCVSESSDWKLLGVLRWDLHMRLDQKNNTDWWPLHFSDSMLYFMSVCSLNVCIWSMCVSLCWSLTNPLTFTLRSARCEGGLGFMEQRQLTCMIHVLHLRCLTGGPPRHTCDSESHYLPQTNLLISHTCFLSWLGHSRRCPAFHKKDPSCAEHVHIEQR